MFRQIVFWLHLIAALISGLVIAILCFTGTVLAFEKQWVAWSERDARQISPPSADSTRLPLDELRARLRTAHPDARPTSRLVNLVLQRRARWLLAHIDDLFLPVEKSPPDRP